MKKVKALRLMDADRVKVGTMLMHSIGSGCHSFHQVTKVTPHTVTVRRVEEKIVRRSLKLQSYTSVPIPGRFEKGYDPQILRVRYFPELELKDPVIGPSKRLQGWSVYRTTFGPVEHYSS